MPKFFITTTVPRTLNFFKGNLMFLSQYFDVSAISSEKDILEKIGKREKIRTYYIPMCRSISLFCDIYCLFKFLFLFTRERPEIVHGNTPKASMLSMLAAWITRVPVRIYMCHGLRYQGTRGGMRKLLMWMERLSCRCATEVICVSHGVRNTLLEDAICPSSKAVVIGAGSASGVDLEYFAKDAIGKDSDIRAQLKIPSDAFLFVFVGRIVADKGINELVEAFEKLNAINKKVELLLIGPEESDLNPINDKSRFIIENNPCIHAVGRKSDVRPYLLASDAFVFPSYREGFGMVLIEAGALGLPAISSDITGCNEIIKPGVNGDLIPSRDTDALYAKMKEWSENMEAVRRMSANACHMVAERYERRKVWNALLNEYQRLINS